MPSITIDPKLDLTVDCALNGAPATDPPPVWEYEWSDDAGNIIFETPAGVPGFGTSFVIPSADLKKPTYEIAIQCTPGGTAAATMDITFSQTGRADQTVSVPVSGTTTVTVDVNQIP